MYWKRKIPLYSMSDVYHRLVEASELTAAESKVTDSCFMYEDW